MNDIDRARLKRISAPGAAGLAELVRYVWPIVFPGERAPDNAIEMTRILGTRIKSEDCP